MVQDLLVCCRLALKFEFEELLRNSQLVLGPVNLAF